MPRAGPAAYHVVPHAGAWAVSHDGRFYDHTTLTEATGAAVRAAAISAAYGRPAHVLSRRPRGGWMLVWDSEDGASRAAQSGTSHHNARLSPAVAD
jgi:hypothetical protein